MKKIHIKHNRLYNFVNIIFYIGCIVYLVTLGLLMYGSKIDFHNHINVYWIYLGPIVMVGYTIMRNFFFKQSKSIEDQQNQLEPQDKTS